MKLLGERMMKCCVLLTQEEELGFVATDALTHIASQGKTLEEAVVNLKEALELYYEDKPEELRRNDKFFATATLDVSV